MKALVFVLVLGNLLFFAYTEGYFGRPDNPDAGRVQQQVHPERIQIVARGDSPPAKASDRKVEVPADKPAAEEKPQPESDQPAPAADKAAPAPEKPAPAAEKPPVLTEKPPVQAPRPVPQEACVAWGDLPPADANRLAGLLGEKFAEFRVERRALPTEGGNWWVFIPPLASKADADRKTGELKRMGITDYFVIQEAGPNRYAVSLGVFSSESGASEHLANLRSKGVRSARMAPRAGKDAHYAFEVRGPAARQEALLAAASGALPGSRTQTCK